jgi:hypothetical protein
MYLICIVELHIITARLMELQHQSTTILLSSRDGLRSNEYKLLQIEIRQLQTQLSNGYKRTTTQNTDTN